MINRKKLRIVQRYHLKIQITNNKLILKVCWIKPFLSEFEWNSHSMRAPTGRPAWLLQPYKCEGRIILHSWSYHSSHPWGPYYPEQHWGSYQPAGPCTSLRALLTYSYIATSPSWVVVLAWEWPVAVSWGRDTDTPPAFCHSRVGHWSMDYPLQRH